MNRLTQRLFFCLCLGTPHAHGQTLPTTADIRPLLIGCGAGTTAGVLSTFEGAIEVWKGEAKGKGRAEASELAGILASLKDEPLKVKVYELYLGCFRPAFSELMARLSEKDRQANSAACRQIDRLTDEAADLTQNMAQTSGDRLEKLKARREAVNAEILTLRPKCTR